MDFFRTISQIKDDFGRKLQLISTYVYLTPPLIWFPFELYNSVGAQED